MGEEIREIEIPDAVHVRCPLRAFHLVRAGRCDGCAHFSGLAETMANPDIPFEKRFLVRCGFPTNRELFFVETDGGAR